jgi:hypothetical protein
MPVSHLNGKYERPTICFDSLLNFLMIRIPFKRGGLGQNYLQGEDFINKILRLVQALNWTIREDKTEAVGVGAEGEGWEVESEY